jgi:hypothetical protein
VISKKPAISVVHRQGVWAVIKDKAERARSVHHTQSEAIEQARSIARREQTELRIQGSDGRWRDSDCYGNDPAPPVDRRH